MLLGARQFFEKRDGGEWQSPYVTDGLVAMWDGEWNAGPGVHDPNATTWVDLSGNGHDLTMPASNAYEIAATAVTFNGRGAAGGASATDLLSVFDGTIEIVAQRSIGHVDPTTRQICNIGPNVYWRGLGTTQGGPIGVTGYSSYYGGYRMYCVPSVETVDSPICLATIFTTQMNDPAQEFYANGVKVGGAYIYNWKEGAPASVTPTIGTASTADGITTMHSVRAYSRNLTAAEIAANYAVDKERFGLP